MLIWFRSRAAQAARGIYRNESEITMTKSVLRRICLFVFAAGVTLLVLSRLEGNGQTSNQAPGPVGDSPALTSEHLSSKIAPVIQNHLEEGKEEIIKAAGGPMIRSAVRLGWPVAMREVQPVTHRGVEALLDEFGKFSISDLAKLLEDHFSKKQFAAGPRDTRLLWELKEAAENRPEQEGPQGCICGSSCDDPESCECGCYR